MKRSAVLMISTLTVLAVVAAVLVWSRSTDGGQVAVEDVVQCQVEGCVAGSVSTASGRLWLEHEDISPDPVSGTIGLQRTYFRGDRQSTSFGPGWRSMLDTRLVERDGVRTLEGFPSLPGAPLGLDGDTVTFADGTRWMFDESGLLTGYTTRTGRSFDIRRSASRVTIAEGERTLINVSLKDDRVERVTDARAAGAGVVAYAYVDGRLSRVTSTSGREPAETYRYAYSPDGGLKQADSANGAASVVWADSRTVGSITVGGQTTKLDLRSAAGSATRVTPPGAAQPTEYLHDGRGRLIEVRQGDSVPLLRKYDPEGRLVRERDPSDDRRFTWTDGRLTKVESSANGTSILGWDKSGRLTSTTVGESVTTYEYEDSMWSPTQVTTAGGTTTYQYQEGRLVEAVDPDGIVTSLDDMDSASLATGADTVAKDEPTCTPEGGDADQCEKTVTTRVDAAGRPVGLSLGETKGAVTYDDYGRVASTSGPNGTERHTYDARGRISSTTRGEVTFANVYEDDRLVRVTAGDEVFASYTYDGRGRLTELASSQGTVRRSYDDLGRVSSIEDGGLEWKVLEFTAAGRPKKIDTPYGMVAITYGEDGRPERTEVSGYGRPNSRDRITTSYDWRAEGDRETARVTRGGYVSTLAFEDGVLTSARTPLGHWGYSYSKEFPGRLSGVSGPNGTASYSYEAAGGLLRLTEAKVGNSARTFTWDDLGRLTSIGGAEERSFEYRKDGITEGGAQGRKVTWNEAGLPETVESNGSTEVWAWNPDRTLKSIASRVGLFGDDVVWNAAYDDQKRLTGLDRQGSADDVSVAWAGSSGEPTHPVRIAVGGSGPALELKWTVPGELRSATLGDQAWKVGRDSFRNVSKVTRSGESAGTISTSWDDGLPVGVKSNEGSLTLEQCSEFDCEVELNIGGATTKLDYSKGSVDTLAAGRKTVFTRNDDGLVTKGCQNVNGENECTRWPVEGESDLARFDELFGGTDGQLRGLASRPLPPDPPAIATLPTEFRPAGLDIELPDEALDAAIAEAVPALPQTYRLGDDGAVVRLGNRLAPTTISIAYGPGVSVPVSVFGDATLGALDSPLGEGGQMASLAGALEGIESDSVARPATDLALRAAEYLPNVLGLAAEFLGSLFAGPIAGAVLLVAAVGACVAGSASCAALAVTGALMLVPGGLGVVVSLLLRETLTAVLDSALAIARGVSWQDAAIAAGAAILIGLVAQNAKPVKRLCGAKRVWCLDASNSPEAAANAVEARGQRWGVLRVDRANVTARRREALSGTPRKSGFDRDEFPPAATRQGGAGARVAYIDPGDNRRAGASLGNAIKDLDDGQRFVYLVVDSSDRPFTLLDSLGAGRAISATRPAN